MRSRRITDVGGHADREDNEGSLRQKTLSLAAVSGCSQRLAGEA